MKLFPGTNQEISAEMFDVAVEQLFFAVLFSTVYADVKYAEGNGQHFNIFPSETTLAE